MKREENKNMRDIDEGNKKPSIFNTNTLYSSSFTNFQSDSTYNLLYD